MRRFLMVLIAGAVIVGGAIGIAQADPISFIPGGALQFKYNDFESLVTTVGTELHGVFTVTTIAGEPFGVPILWASGLSDGTQLNGIFKGLIANTITPGSTTEIKFKGGELALYNVPGGTFDSTKGLTTAAICPGGVCPAPWLTANFSPGILLGDLVDTLDSTVTSLTGPASGKGTGFLDVGPNSFGTGINDARFATKGFTDANGIKHDLFLESDLIICPGPGCDGVNPVASHDPVHTFATPEPGSLLLLGIGLLAMGGWRRLRKA